MRLVVADTLVEPLVIWMVGVLLVPEVVDEIGIAVGPCHDGMVTLPTNKTKSFCHRLEVGC